MIIGGLQKFSLLDFPGFLSAIIFTQGCNFRCQYCYNPMLVWSNGQAKSQTAPSGGENQKGYPGIEEDDLFDFLKKRQGKLDAVVITGGEPTLHHDLMDFIVAIRGLGYKIKLDTNGTNPDMLKELLTAKVLDYVAMDIKSSPRGYNQVTGIDTDMNKLSRSVNMLIGSEVPHEFRSTIVPGLHSRDDIEEMGKMVSGAQKWFLQKFKSDMDLVNSEFETMPGFSDVELGEMKKIAERFVAECRVR